MLSSASFRSTSHQVPDELAALSFVNKFINNGYNTSVALNVCALYDALYSLYLQENRGKILLLYFHNEETQFSKDFCTFVSKKEVENVLTSHFNVLGLDVGDDTYQEILIERLQGVLQLLPCVDMVRNKETAIIFVSHVDMDFEICTTIRRTLDLENFKYTLEILADTFCKRFIEESPMCEEVSEEAATNSFSYEDFQQKMFNMLGNRDYDIFEAVDLEKLKEKIAFALFGIPTEDGEYFEKQQEEIIKMYETILEANNEFSEYKNQVVMAVIYTCLVPLDSGDSKQQFTPVPVFVLRKCRESENPCRSFVDHTRRVYSSWDDYLEGNKFCECLMIVPEDGRYVGDADGRVKLVQLESPACRVGKKVLKATDIASTVLGVGSSGVMVAAAVPAIPVAPFLLLGAAAVGVGVGVYSIGRSISTLVDRGMHNESLNVTESEARGAYLNIAAGAVGFAGAGANAVVSQLAANGVAIGTGARIAVNTLGVANIGISGIAVGNSAVEIFLRWWIDDESPTALSVLQLSTSILFFGHAVYSFKTAGTIIEESQTTVLKDYKEMLKSNRQRKMFRKLELETLSRNNGNIQKGRAEVISAIRRIKNADDVFSFLVRTNKDLNKMGIKFAAQDGEIVFNGIPIDLAEVSAISRSDVYGYFSDLSSKSKTTVVVNDTRMNFDFNNLIGIESAHFVIKKLVSPGSLQEKLCTLVAEVSAFFIDNYYLEIINRQFNLLFPNGARYIGMMKMLLSFIQKQVETLLDRFERNEMDSTYSFIFKYIGNLSSVERKLVFMQRVCDEILMALHSVSPRERIANLIKYCSEWIINALMEREETSNQDAETQSTERNNRQVVCKNCSGYYFK